MTQFFLDADNGDDTHSGLNAVQTASVVITSSDADDSVLTAAVHGLTTGDFVNIIGHTSSTPDINGANQQITVVDTTNFTIDGVDITIGGTGGTMQEEDGPFATLNQYAENTRSASDIGTCRRGMTATYDDAGPLAPLSDGTFASYITIEGDYDDSWGDDANTTVTFTPVFGSKTLAASADPTGEVSAGDWVYVVGDDNRLFAYEVKTSTTSPNEITTYLPWKGSTGAGKTLTVMPASPVYGTVVSVLTETGWNGDDYWKLQGIHVKYNGTGTALDFDSSRDPIVKDCVAESGNSTSTELVNAEDDAPVIWKKLRILRGVGQGNTILQTFGGYSRYIDCLFDGLGTPSNLAVAIDGGTTNSAAIVFEECEFANFADLFNPTALYHSSEISGYKLRNCVLTNITNVIDTSTTFSRAPKVFFEDFDGTPNATRVYTMYDGADNIIGIQSETTTVRTGGSNISLKITPEVGINITNEERGRLRILEAAFFATTASKKYEIFFRPDATANWTDDPTAAQLWIELEYWGHASNSYRRITKSTGTIDMNGSTTFTALSVTVAPAQAGVAYLRVWYGKPKEGGKTNVFFVDPIPVIT